MGGGVRQAEEICDILSEHFYLHQGEGPGDCGILSGGSGVAFVCDLFDIGQRGACQSRCGGYWNGAGQVGDTEVYDSIAKVCRILIGCGAGCFDAASLIYSDVHDDGTGSHFLDEWFAHENGGSPARRENRPDQEVCSGDG